LNDPLYMAHIPRRLTPRETAPATRPPAPGMPSRPRCLVVVESSSVRGLVRQILSLEGWEATEQEEAAPSSYQAVVADLDCFVWPGDRVIRTVQQAATSGLPVLALTGQDLNPQEYAAIGSPLLLTKPFELAHFIQVLHAWAHPPALGTSF